MSDDDWETDPDYENTVSEEQQRYGSNHTVCGRALPAAASCGPCRGAPFLFLSHAPLRLPPKLPPTPGHIGGTLRGVRGRVVACLLAEC